MRISVETTHPQGVDDTARRSRLPVRAELLAALPVAELALRLATPFTIGDCSTLIEGLLAATETNLDLAAAARKVEAQRDQREPLCLHLGADGDDFGLMEQEAPHPLRLVVLTGSTGPLGDVHADEATLARIEAHVRHRQCRPCQHEST